VAVEGANLQLINHGLSSAGLFALVGMLYERFHTRSIPNLGGVATKAPWLTVMFMLFTFSSIGLPGLNGFVGEFLILAGSFQRAWAGVAPTLRFAYLALAVAAVGGVVLGAWYMLWAVERVFFGASREPPRHGAADDGHGHGHAAHDGVGDRCDLAWHEIAALAPLAFFAVWIGLAPAAFLAAPAAELRRATDGASAAFAARMRSLEEGPGLPASPPGSRVVRHDPPSRPQPLAPTADRP
jgi:NADH-quinone oxidoreductase subunit M